MKTITSKEILYSAVSDHFKEIKKEYPELKILGYRFKNDESFENIAIFKK